MDDARSNKNQVSSSIFIHQVEADIFL